MWSNFDRKAYTQSEFQAHVASLKWTAWKPNGITLHNTSAPTLAQWVETGPKHDARITNLQSYYEGMGWHAGPHLFVSRNFINGFSNLLLAGVHSRCWNATRIGIEMVGDFDSEGFDSGDGALVRDNAVFAMAVLNLKLGLTPDGLVFHRECKQDNHACPGKLVNKAAVIARVKAKMADLAAGMRPVDSASLPVVNADQHVRVKVDGLNLRRGAGATNSSMGVLPVDTILTVTGATVNNGGTGWVPVKTPMGYGGWVAASFIEWL